MTDMMQGIITIVVIIVIAIIAIILIKWLISAVMIAPITAYAQEDEQQKEVDKATIDVGNDTEITVTCTSNIPDLVSCN